MRNIYFAIYGIVLIALYFEQLGELTKLALDVQLYSHFLVIPFVSAFLLFKRREAVLSEISYSAQIGMPIVAVGVWISYDFLGSFPDTKRNTPAVAVMTKEALSGSGS